MKRSIKVILSIAIIMAFVSTSLGLTAIAVKSIKLNAASVNISVGKTYGLKVAFTPANATNKKVAFSSSNKSVASVSTGGYIKGIKSGKAVITVTSAANKKAVAKCNVTVSEAATSYKNKIKMTYSTGWTGQANISREKTNEHPGTKNDLLFQFLEKKFNMEIYVREEMTADKLLLGLASGEPIDIYTIPSWSATHKELYTKMKKDGLLLDIKKIVSKDPGRYPVLTMILKNANTKLINEFISGDADAFDSIPTLDYNKPGKGGGVTFNMLPFKGTGQKVPETMDEFINILRAYKEKGMIPFSPNLNVQQSWGLGSINDVFFNPYGSHIKGFYKDDNGNWYDAAINKKNIEIWKKIAELYKEGLIKKDVLTQPYYGNVTEWVDDKIGCIDYFAPATQPGQYTWAINQFLEKHKDATYKDVPMPTRPLKVKGVEYAKEGYTPFGFGTIRNCVYAGTKDPERMLDFLEFMLSDKGQDLIWWGIEGVTYKVDASGNKQLIGEVYQKLMWHVKNPEKDRTAWNYFWGITNSSMNYVQYQRDGGWLEGAKKAIDLNYRLRPVEGAVKYCLDVIKNYVEDGVKANPEFMNFVNFSDDTDLLVQSKVNDVFLKYALSFLVAEKDPEKEWDSFVKDYNDAGGAALLKKYVKLYNDVEKKYNATNK